MQQHHLDAIERWAEAAAEDDEVLAVVVAGSLAKGYGLADGDVDGFVIVTDEAFARRRASGELTFFSTELCNYEGGYVDPKYVDRAFLEAVLERGSEPARSAFFGCEPAGAVRLPPGPGIGPCGTPPAAEAVVMSLLLFREWPQAPAGWSTQFMLDSEWNWLDGEPPIDDL